MSTGTFQVQLPDSQHHLCTFLILFAKRSSLGLDEVRNEIMKANTVPGTVLKGFLCINHFILPAPTEYVNSPHSAIMRAPGI